MSVGVVLIDCWEPPAWKRWVNDLYKNIEQQIQKSRPAAVVNAAYGDATKSAYLKKHVTHSVNSFDEFVSLAKELEISTWICMGRDWQICVHNNAVGLLSLQRANITVICTVGTCSESTGEFITAQDFQDDMLPWIPLNDREYQLGVNK